MFLPVHREPPIRPGPRRPWAGTVPWSNRMETGLECWEE